MRDLFFTGTSTLHVHMGWFFFLQNSSQRCVSEKAPNMKGLLVKTQQSGKGVILFCISKWGAARDQSITETCACTCVVVSFTPRHLFNKHSMMMGCPKTLHCLRFRMIFTINDYPTNESCITFIWIFTTNRLKCHQNHAPSILLNNNGIFDFLQCLEKVTLREEQTGCTWAYQ